MSSATLPWPPARVSVPPQTRAGWLVVCRGTTARPATRSSGTTCDYVIAVTTLNSSKHSYNETVKTNHTV